jgi:hypothetical protein
LPLRTAPPTNYDITIGVGLPILPDLFSLIDFHFFLFELGAPQLQGNTLICSLKFSKSSANSCLLSCTLTGKARIYYGFRRLVCKLFRQLLERRIWTPSEVLTVLGLVPDY